MRINTINLQIVRNLGNYETLRICAEWTPDSNQTLADAMAAGMAELNATADILTGKKTAQAAPAAEPQPDELDAMNAAKDGDTREVVTLATPNKFNNILGRIVSGVEVSKVFAHYRFDADTLALLRAAINGQRVTLAFGDAAFEALVKAVETQKPVANICNCFQFADQNTANAWDLAVKMCNKQ